MLTRKNAFLFFFMRTLFSFLQQAFTFFAVSQSLVECGVVVAVHIEVVVGHASGHAKRDGSELRGRRHGGRLRSKMRVGGRQLMDAHGVESVTKFFVHVHIIGLHHF